MASKEPAEEIVEPPEKSACEELLRYRHYVAAFAGGVQLTSEDVADLDAVRESLSIPDWTMGRDIAAVLRWQAADRRERVELLHGHPHLFDVAEAWVASFIDKRIRLRRVPSSAVTTGVAGS